MNSNKFLPKAGEAPKASKEDTEGVKANPIRHDIGRLTPRSIRRQREMEIESPLTPELDRLVYELIGLGMDVHSALGPGLREQVYEDAYIIALETRGLSYVRQVPFKISYQGRSIRPIRIDLVVEGQVIVELKAVTQLHDVHFSQLMTYLKLTDLPVGILLNFNVRHLRDGIRRFVRSQPK